jgi:Zn-dependent protease
VFHEIAHGYVAYVLGDHTAKNAGRLSLNPFRHIDLFGTVLLPALLVLANAPVFGYAKPVPINPYFFKNRRVGMMLTGLAGPATNLVFGALAGLAYRFMSPLPALQSGVGGWVMQYVLFLTYVNFLLMFFNLIPIPPFDGSRVIPLFLNDSGLRFYANVERYGFLIILLLLYVGGGLLQAYMNLTAVPLFHLFSGVSL